MLKQLFYSVLFSVPMILLRALYGAISLFESTSSSMSHTISTSLASSVCMSVVPQIQALFSFVVVGFTTRNVMYAELLPD
jgi:hypothetical protein